MTSDSPLVDADFMTDLDFCLADGNMDIALKDDSKESVLELCLLSSATSLFAAARSNLQRTELSLLRDAISRSGKRSSICDESCVCIDPCKG